MRTAALVVALFGLNACSDAIVGASFNSSAAGALAFAAFMDAGNPGYMDMRAPPSFTGPYGAFWARPMPELDRERKISEQDCTKPLDLSQGNIRCK